MGKEILYKELVEYPKGLLTEVLGMEDELLENSFSCLIGNLWQLSKAEKNKAFVVPQKKQ